MLSMVMPGTIPTTAIIVQLSGETAFHSTEQTRTIDPRAVYAAHEFRTSHVKDSFAGNDRRPNNITLSLRQM